MAVEVVLADREGGVRVVMAVSMEVWSWRWW